jgi:hypothetical protein
MPPSLPRHPDPGILKKQAKMLLAAQRRRAPASCDLFRRIRRFSGSTDVEILEATVTLTESQLALALHYGYGGWKEMMDEVRSYPGSAEFSLKGVRDRAEETLPDYAGAGVPLAVVAALNHAGVPIRFMEFVAASGWSFSFGYHYHDESPAYMAVRGKPGSDGPFEVFAFLPEMYGLGYEMALTERPDQLWDFVQEKVDSGTPVMSEHMDGGLITSYRERNGSRQLFFDGTVMPGWVDVAGLNPYAVYSFVREGEARPQEEITRAALGRAVAKGREREWEEVTQGLAALRAYLEDVKDPTKDFSTCETWFCWATFERLMARRCSEVWLRTVASTQSGAAMDLLSTAADHYGEAFRCYDRYLGEIEGCSRPNLSLQERARTPERIEVIAPILERGIAAEASGLEVLEETVELIHPSSEAESV